MTMLATCNSKLKCNRRRCDLHPTGESRMIGREIRQGMASKTRYKFVKVYKLVCRSCGRGTWKE